LKDEHGKQITQVPNQDFEFPVLCLVTSGGHTELILMKDYGVYEKIGGTRDDAAGEAFDKVAKLLDLEYPGGPKISKFALEGNPHAIPFPRPMIDSDNYDMSFAGLKTSALYWLRDNKLAVMKTHAFDTIFSWLPSRLGISNDPITIHDFCASYEQAIVDVLVSKTSKAIKEYKPKMVILGGGVSANKKLRETLAETAKSMGSELKTSNLPYAMDNAAMIGLAGYEKAKRKEYTQWNEIQANPNWKIYEKSG
jgi:N6-L-threonylcarbamoyladenine synthase